MQAKRNDFQQILAISEALALNIVCLSIVSLNKNNISFAFFFALNATGRNNENIENIEKNI